MASITFASGTLITSTWLNDVDALVWDVFSGATTAALARTALSLDNHNTLTVNGSGVITSALSATGGGSLTGTWTDLGSVTTIDINGGTIDGATIATSNITVGAGKTFDVSGGTLTLAANQISGDKIDGGTISNFASTGIDDNSAATSITIISNGNVGIGVTPTERFEVSGAGTTRILVSDSTAVASGQFAAYSGGVVIGSVTNHALRFRTNDIQRIAIASGGSIHIGKDTTGGLFDAGIEIGGTGEYIAVSRGGAAALYVNRNTDDGTLVGFYQAGVEEGTITVAGTTVSYGSFCGHHWSQLTDTTNSVLEKGTVVSTIDEMCSWNGENNEQLAKVKISDVVADKRVYGVFCSLDEDGDAIIHALGATVIRVTGPCHGGDLLDSNGDGTAKVQTDDVIRSSTIGKVTVGNINVGIDEVHVVPCVLYCG